MTPAQWVPLRWPSVWTDAASTLRVLEGTIFNCIVDAPNSAAEAVRRCGCEAINQSALPAAITPVKDAVWPSVQPGRHADTQAGPTGPPWVDSNGWRCRLARARKPSAIPWVFVDPPKDNAALRAASYAVAIADAAAFGGCWVVSLDAGFAKALQLNQAAARQQWAQITKTAAFFAARREWLTYPTLANLAILSDFTGDNEFFAQELLNLAPRRQLSAAAVDRTLLVPGQLQPYKAVLWADAAAPDVKTAEALMHFVENGGLVIAPPSAVSIARDLKAGPPHASGYAYYVAQKGAIAIAPKPWDDPYLAIADAHLVLSRKLDVFRIFNAGSNNVHCTQNQGGGVLVHIVNYTGRPAANPMTLSLTGQHRAATIHTPSQPAPAALPVIHKSTGTEVALPPFSTYAAIEFGGKS